MIGKTISHYKILEKLGEGGMSVVYKAEDTKLDRFIALKFLPSHLSINEIDKERFIQEAKAASAINHPNVCVIHDIQEQNDDQFIVMEFVDGITLHQKVQTVQLDLKDVIGYAIQIGEALKAAHQKDITVEGELGTIGGKEEHIDNVGREMFLTDPEKVVQFQEETGIDSLAVAIGTQHGFYDHKYELDFNRLGKIMDITDFPIVVHGCSGIAEKDLKRLISFGPSKMNISTEIKHAYIDSCRKYFEWRVRVCCYTRRNKRRSWFRYVVTGVSNSWRSWPDVDNKSQGELKKARRRGRRTRRNHKRNPSTFYG